MLSFFDSLETTARRLKQETYTLYLAYRNASTPWYARILAAIVVAYAFSPIDLVPDFIPLLGYLDDLILVPLGIALTLKMIPEEVLTEARAEAEKSFQDGKPRNWAAGAIILLIWIGLAALGILWFLRWVQDWPGG
jgi:uncharacterized membrane protein YkvA (DUF1232 family)